MAALIAFRDGFETPALHRLAKASEDNDQTRLLLSLAEPMGRGSMPAVDGTLRWRFHGLA